MSDRAEYFEPMLQVLAETDIDHPICSAELERRFGLGGEKIRGIIHNLRIDGYPIGSDRRGYYMAQYADELDESINHIGGRKRSLTELEAAMIRTRACMPPRKGQAPTLEQLEIKL